MGSDGIMDASFIIVGIIDGSYPVVNTAFIIFYTLKYSDGIQGKESKRTGLALAGRR
jgi:hypothetical protein